MKELNFHEIECVLGGKASKECAAAQRRQAQVLKQCVESADILTEKEILDAFERVSEMIEKYC